MELEGVGVVVGAHRRGVPGDDPALHPVADRPGGHDLQEAALLVVGLVAVKVDRRARLPGQVEQEVDLLDAVVAGPLVVRDAADDVAAEAHRLAHQLLAVRERQDPVLGEGDEPEVDDVADLLAELERARRATRFGSHTSTCERMSPVPWATSQRIASGRAT